MSVRHAYSRFNAFLGNYTELQIAIMSIIQIGERGKERLIELTHSRLTSEVRMTDFMMDHPL
jgi:hypothetical protein